jgi:hypothetical protein
MEYHVKFIGYIGLIVTRKEIIHAALDFVTGSTQLDCKGGSVVVPTRRELAPFVASLPTYLHELNDRRNRNTARGKSREITAGHGASGIHLAQGADPRQVIRVLQARLRQIEPVLEQTDIIGSQIGRKPYLEYMDEIRQTGVARVPLHGLGIFKDGKLVFHPANLSVAIKPTEGKTNYHILWDESSPEIMESDTAYWDYFVEGAKDIAAARTANREEGLTEGWPNLGTSEFDSRP